MPEETPGAPTTTTGKTRGEPSRAQSARSAVSNTSVRRQNLSNIISLLHVDGPITRSQISSQTGLSRSSVAALISELETGGLVQETRSKPDGRPGRPSPVLGPKPGSAVVAFEIVVDSIAVAVVGLGGRVLSQRRYDRPRDSVSTSQTLKDLCRLADSCRSDAGDPNLLSAGVAVAGLVDSNSDKVVFAPNLGWEGVDLASVIRSECNIDAPVSIRNEGELALRAEARRGAGRGCTDAVYISAEVGVGGGIMSNGELLLGRSGLAGEVGHIPINLDGTTCKCGATGCFETEVGERALLSRAGLDPNGGRAEIARLFERSADGDEAALEAFAASGKWLGLGIATLAHTLNPEKVILGGLYQQGFAFVADAIGQVLAERSFPTLAAMEVVPSELGDSARLLGAAELAFDPVLADPLSFPALTNSVSN